MLLLDQVMSFSSRVLKSSPGEREIEPGDPANFQHADSLLDCLTLTRLPNDNAVAVSVKRTSQNLILWFKHWVALSRGTTFIPTSILIPCFSLLSFKSCVLSPGEVCNTLSMQLFTQRNISVFHPFQPVFQAVMQIRSLRLGTLLTLHVKGRGKVWMCDKARVKAFRTPLGCAQKNE